MKHPLFCSATSLSTLNIITDRSGMRVKCLLPFLRTGHERYYLLVIILMDNRCLSRFEQENTTPKRCCNDITWLVV